MKKLAEVEADSPQEALDKFRKLFPELFEEAPADIAGWTKISASAEALTPPIAGADAPASQQKDR